MSNPCIVQFGTSRFLQAHVDLFASEAADRGQKVVPIVVVQTSRDPERAGRVEAFGGPDGYPVIIRGLDAQGVAGERIVTVHSIDRGIQAARDWDLLVAAFVDDAAFVFSNTGDRGYEVAVEDRRVDLLATNVAPRSFPGILLVLLHRRWLAGGAPLTLLPCELVRRNAEVLGSIIADLAVDLGASPAFVQWLDQGCRWVSTLVDRIVSEAIEPIGAVAEPYALWAVERRPGLDMPFEHPDVVMTDDLERYERLKLHILNLGHTWLAQRWLEDGSPLEETVRERLADPETRTALERLYADEVVPAFAAHGLGDEARDYVATTLGRFANPYLNHRLADIATNHSAKIEKRVGALLAWIDETETRPNMTHLEALVRRAAKVAG